jgi:hypothetical protein
MYFILIYVYSICMYVDINIYIYTHVCLYVYMYIYIYVIIYVHHGPVCVCVFALLQCIYRYHACFQLYGPWPGKRSYGMPWLACRRSACLS